MAQKLNLNICYLYPDLMDTYGDIGNITALIKRCAKRQININVTDISIGDTVEKNKYDLFFFGGGQDKTQMTVGRDLQKNQESIIESIDSGAVLLSICGGYQLLQNYFTTLDNKTIKGIGLFDAHTQGSNARLIQNLLLEINPLFEADISNNYKSSQSVKPSSKLVGFENHSGKTYLGKNTIPLGFVIKGAGNNGEDKTEGAKYKNAFGCYLHGSLLPKNPHFADYLIRKALERNYGKVNLKPLDDYTEWQSHNQSINTTRSQS